ncbi:MAG: zinc-ribbon domain-containing protein [Candidatus Micrarchaeota archaeon]
MQAQVEKKDKLPVIKCPRCHAENLVIQDQCGRCGFVFPKDTPYKKKDKDNPMFNRTPVRNPAAGAPDPNALMGNRPGAQEEGEEEGGIPKPTRPKHIPEKGVSEGLRVSRGKWLLCPRCGADVAQDAKRCPRCGWKPQTA